MRISIAAMAMSLLMAVAWPAQAKVPRFYGADIAIGGGQVWGIGPLKYFGEGKIYQLKSGGWSQYPGMAVRISVGPDGLVLIVDKDGKIEMGGPGRGWKKIPGQALDIEAGVSGKVWMVGHDGSRRRNNIYYWSKGAWRQVKGEAMRIAVDPLGNPWIIDRRTDIYRWQGGRFKRVYGSARDIAIGPGGQVWIIGGPRKDGTWLWNGTGWRRKGRSGQGLAVDAQGQAWVVDPKRGLAIYK